VRPYKDQVDGFHTASAETFSALEHEHEELGLGIDELTAMTAWQGEVMDYGWGVEALIKRAYRA
jgi:hypothetical protein